MEELIRRCQQGDRASMGQLYTAMHDELLAQCRKYAANDGIAEDLLHDAFLLIFSNIDQLRSAKKGVQWMHKVVKNVCLLYVQNRQNHTLVSIDEVRETSLGPEPDIAVSYDDILNAIDHLPNGYRQVFRLSVLEGLTHPEIAELLGIEPHTSSSQLLRAKKQLRHLLQVLMLSLLAAIPLGGYYLWSLQRNKQNVDETSEVKPTDIIAITDTTGSLPTVDMHHEASVKGQNTHKVKEIGLPLDTIGTQATANALITEEAQVTENVLATEGTQESSHDVAADDKKADDHEITINEAVVAHPNLSLSLAYNGLPNGTGRSLPYGVDGINGDIDSVTHHRMPITVALNARYHLGSHWWFDGGLRYTQLSSETQVGNTFLFMEQQQRVRYLGLSLGIGHHLWHRQKWSLYATTSLTFELPLHSTVETSYWKGGQLIDSENNKLSPHPQWSVGIGMGLQYNLTPTIGFFAEPSLQYYFHNSDGINTWRTEHPFTPILPFGIRITF